MFKYTLFFLAAIMITAASCQKNASQVEPKPEPVDSSGTEASYLVSGLRDVLTKNVGSTDLNVTVSRASGAEQKITLSVNGMPEGSEVEFTGESGYTTFSTAIKFITRFAKPGVYPVSLVAKSESGESRVYNINLTVEEISRVDCNEVFVNSLPQVAFNTYADGTDSIVYDQTLVYYTPGQSQIYISRMVMEKEPPGGGVFVGIGSSASQGLGVSFIFSCNDGTISIPLQEIEARDVNSWGTTRDYKVSGDGLVDVETNTMSISYTTQYELNGNIETHKYVIKSPFEIK